MPIVTRGSLFTLTTVAIGAVLAGAAFAWSGLYDIGADDTHTRPVAMVLQTLREHSISHHARGLAVPPLGDEAMIRRGAGNFEAMCSQCHTPPGEEQGELSRGLYPAPPNLTAAVGDPAREFWVIKHGIKASGMPAWGKSMDDASIWGMVAFLQQLPRLDAGQYDAIVGASGGLSHGGGDPHDEHMHAAAEAMQAHDAHMRAAGEPVDGQGMHDMPGMHGHQATPEPKATRP